MTNEQKAAKLEEMAVSQDRLSVVLFPADSRKALADAALLREAAAMMRERGESGWTAQFERQHKGRTLTITEAKPGGWYWCVYVFPNYTGNFADTLAAAQAAAIAWVDEQEGK